MSRAATVGAAVATALVVAAGVTVVADRGGGHAHHTPPESGLSAADRAALRADSVLVDSLPQAFAEVPQAAADVAGTTVPAAHAGLARLTALAPLLDAVDGRSAAISLLVSSYRSLVDDGVGPAEPRLPAALDTLQAVEGDVLPAVRVIALQHGHDVTAAAALTAVERDPRTPALARLLADWSELYGVLVLVEAAAGGYAR